MLNVGDLVQASEDYHLQPRGLGCNCFFCLNNNRDAIGIVTTVWIEEDDCHASIIEFPIGEWVFRENEYKQLNIISAL